MSKRSFDKAAQRLHWPASGRLLKLRFSTPKNYAINLVGTVRNIHIILICCLLATPVYGAQKDPVFEAEAFFDNVQYREGLEILTKAYGDRSLASEQRADVLRGLGQFYENLVGNYEMAGNFYRKILDLDLAADHPSRSFAQQKTLGLTSLEQTYQDHNALLRMLRNRSNSQDVYEIEDNIAQLSTLIEENPQYYKLPEALYYLGVNYVAHKEYRRALKVFRRILEMKPAADIYYLAVTPQIRIASRLWRRTIASQAAWGTAGMLLIVTILLFYHARPWRWVRFRHLGIGIVMGIAWWGTFTLSSQWFATHFEVPATAMQELKTKLPSLVRTAPGSPGSDVIRTLFGYGLVGVCGMFVFSIGTSRLTRRWIAFLFNALAGFLVFAALTTIFYLRYCEDDGVFISEHAGKLHYVQGAVYLYPINPVPYILTDPETYADLEIMDLTRPDFGSVSDENVDLLRWIINQLD